MTALSALSPDPVLMQDGHHAPLSTTPEQEWLYDARADLYQAASIGLRDYVQKNGFRSVLLGLSGGIDSALVAAMAADCMGAEHVYAVMLPSPFTSHDSREDAALVASRLGISYRSIDIHPAMQAFETMLKEPFQAKGSDIAKENVQARIRGTALMALSNVEGHLLLATSNKSELAVGYSTLYGDMCGGYMPLKDLYKTQVYELCAWRNAQQKDNVIPSRIITKAPSAELRHDQTDQDSLPPYDDLDRLLRFYIEARGTPASAIANGEPAELANRVWALLQRNEYKRIQAAPGPKLSESAFGRDWRQPLSNKFHK